MCANDVCTKKSCHVRSEVVCVLMLCAPRSHVCANDVCTKKSCVC